MRLLHLYWPHLPIRLARVPATPSSFPTDRPVVLGGQPWTDGTVIDADPAARALGVRRGIPLGSAHRLAPEAAFLDPEPEADAAAVEAAFETLARFSPGLAGTTDQTDAAFGLIELQADGLDRLWGPEPRPRRPARAGAWTAGCPAPPRPGIAGTRFAATVAAGHTEPGVLAGPSSPATTPAFLAPLPSIAPLARRRTSAPGSTRFGLRRIGQVAELPKSALVARFGEEGERLHARLARRGAGAVPAAARPGAADAGAPHRPARGGDGVAPVRPPPARERRSPPRSTPGGWPPPGRTSG